MKMSDCKDCSAVQEAEQNPNTECDSCGWAQFTIGSDDDFVSPTLENDEPEEDFLTGVTCNPDAPEECESCQ